MKRTEGREESSPETQLRREKGALGRDIFQRPNKTLTDAEDWESTFNVLCAVQHEFKISASDVAPALRTPPQ